MEIQDDDSALARAQALFGKTGNIQEEQIEPMPNLINNAAVVRFRELQAIVKQANNQNILEDEENETMSEISDNVTDEEHSSINTSVSMKSDNTDKSSSDDHNEIDIMSLSFNTTDEESQPQQEIQLTKTHWNKMKNSKDIVREKISIPGEYYSSDEETPKLNYTKLLLRPYISDDGMLHPKLLKMWKHNMTKSNSGVRMISSRTQSILDNNHSVAVRRMDLTRYYDCEGDNSELDNKIEHKGDLIKESNLKRDSDYDSDTFDTQHDSNKGGNLMDKSVIVRKSKRIEMLAGRRGAKQNEEYKCIADYKSKCYTEIRNVVLQVLLNFNIPLILEENFEVYWLRTASPLDNYLYKGNKIYATCMHQAYVEKEPFQFDTDGWYYVTVSWEQNRSKKDWETVRVDQCSNMAMYGRT